MSGVRIPPLRPVVSLVIFIKIIEIFGKLTYTFPIESFVKDYMIRFFCTMFSVFFSLQLCADYGYSPYCSLKYQNNFTQFDYTETKNKSGGELKLSALGAFDSLFPYNIKGVPAEGLFLVYDSLLKRSLDEPFAMYGRIAADIQVAKDYSGVVFTLNSDAKFHNGNTITADDVKATFDFLRNKGPFTLKQAFKKIKQTENLGSDQVKFTFTNPGERFLPLLIGYMPILSSADLKSNNQSPIGSGPYRIKKHDFGKSINFELVQDYWGKDLPVNVGQNHFDEIQYVYFRDHSIAYEAFKAGQIDLLEEQDIGRWIKKYDFPAAKRGDVVLREIPHQRPGLLALVFNTRRPLFKDMRVRQALAYAFDFEHINRNYFYGALERSKSYFANSELGAKGKPSQAVQDAMSAVKAFLPKRAFEEPFEPLHPEPLNYPRNGLQQAIQLLKEAGWVIKDNQLIHKKSGDKFTFTILLNLPEYKRVALAFSKNLEKLGIKVQIRMVDSAHYQQSLHRFDFDMIINNWEQSSAPGEEQRKYWSSKAAITQGSANYPGIKNAAVDQLIDKLIKAKDYQELKLFSDALDRVLLYNHYVIPLFHKTKSYLAYWRKLGQPKITPVSAFSLVKWWSPQCWWNNS
jgi:microcin C transport system substrate-binding protein